MTQAVAQLLEEAEHLSHDERAELAGYLMEGLGDDVSQEIFQAQIEIVRKRMREVESGEVATIPGEA